MKKRTPHSLATLLLGLLLLAVYWPGLAGGFFFDDGPSILQAPGVQMRELSAEALAKAWSSGGAGPTGRPVAQLSFALNYYFSGFDPRAFKLANLLIHALCGVLIYALLRELLTGVRLAKALPEARWMALAGAAVWALHPLQLLPVLHVVQRMTSLSALFLLLAFWLHIMARRGTGKAAGACMIVAWGLAWPLSILGKETGLLLPVFVLAWELLLRRNQVGRLDTFARLYITVVGLASLGLLLYLASGGAQWVWTGYDFRPFDHIQRLLSEARVLWFYVGLALLPRWSALGLYHDDIVVSSSWFEPWTTVPAVLGWIAVLWLLWSLRRRQPLTALGLAWFLVGHLLESTVLPLELVHEHRNYLPLLGLLLVLLGALNEFVQRGKLSPRALAGLGLVAVLGCAALTAVRSHQYGDDLRRTLAEVQHHPNSARARHNLGSVLAKLPAAAQPGSMVHGMARDHLDRATVLDPNFKMALLDMLGLGCRTGQGVDASALAELSRRLRSTLFAPGDRNVLYYLKEMTIAGQMCLNREQVLQLFSSALANPKVDPGVRVMLHSWLADYLWLKQRDLVGAKEALGQALALNPGNPSNRLKWAQLLWLEGDRHAAKQQLLKLRTEPLLAEERQTLEELLAEGNITLP